MKKIFNLFMLTIFAILYTSCGNQSIDEPKSNDEVDFTIDFTTFQSGSMTRGAEDLYSAFFEENIANKMLCPQSYSLNFGDITTVAAKWEDHKIFHLPSGEYTVTGKSYPKLDEANSFGCDSVYMNFDEKVNINKQTSNVTLNAKYDCYLLLFDDANTSKVEIGNESLSEDLLKKRQLPKWNNTFYVFVNSKYVRPYSSYSSTYYMYIYITRKDGSKLQIRTENIPFEKGKYYYFDDMSASFNIVPMVSGEE